MRSDHLEVLARSHKAPAGTDRMQRWACVFEAAVKDDKFWREHVTDKVMAVRTAPKQDADHILDLGKSLTNSPLREAKDRRLGILEQLVDRAPAIHGLGHNIGSDLTQLAQNGLVLHDSRVMFDVGRGHRALGQLRNGGDAPDGIKLTQALQSIDQSHHIRRLAIFVEIQQRAKDLAVRLPIEIFNLENLVDICLRQQKQTGGI